MTAAHDVTCDVFDDEASDLALGHVTGPRRAALLDHAAACARCDEVLADLAAVCDRMLHLAPEVEPPVGFEARAVARMGVRRRRPRTLRLAVAVAAAVVLLLAGVAIGVAADGDRGEGDSDLVAGGPILTAEGKTIGTAELQRGERGEAARVVLTMDGPSSWKGTWTCELEVDGRWVEVGAWTADEVTNHVWAAGVNPALAGATRMRILGGSGSVIATTDFRP